MSHVSVILFFRFVFKCPKQQNDLSPKAVETGIISRALVILWVCLVCDVLAPVTIQSPDWVSLWSLTIGLKSSVKPYCFLFCILNISTLFWFTLTLLHFTLANSASSSRMPSICYTNITHTKLAAHPVPCATAMLHSVHSLRTGGYATAY